MHVFVDGGNININIYGFNLNPHQSFFINEAICPVNFTAPSFIPSYLPQNLTSITCKLPAGIGFRALIKVNGAVASNSQSLLDYAAPSILKITGKKNQQENTLTCILLILSICECLYRQC